MREFGLIGKKLSHSFSKKYFEQKFQKEQIEDCRYSLFELDSVDVLEELILDHPELIGLNVTIPFKESVIPFLSQIDQLAKEIGAVNTLKISKNGIKGFNTDYYGFETSLKKWIGGHQIKRALILGSGGASKAVKVALYNMGIKFDIVSRNSTKGNITYAKVDPEIISNCHLIINTTPLGMYPQTDNSPDLPYHALTKNHFLYDLIYNPEITLFMKKGKEYNAQVKNGLEMLELQAEKAWDIWNS